MTDLLSADLLDLKLAMNRSVSPLMQKLKQVIVGVYLVLRIDPFTLRYSYSLRNQMLFVLFLEQLCLSFVVCYHISYNYYNVSQRFGLYVVIVMNLV